MVPWRARQRPRRARSNKAPWLSKHKARAAHTRHGLLLTNELVYFLLRRWWRVLRSNLRCFFLDIRLRRFLITEPTGPTLIWVETLRTHRLVRHDSPLAYSARGPHVILALTTVQHRLLHEGGDGRLWHAK